MSATAADGVPYATQVPVPPGFDVTKQSVILYRGNGTAYDPIPLANINVWAKGGYRLNFQYGALFGLAFGMLLNLICLTPAKTRRTIIFNLQCISLALVLIRSVCQGLIWSTTVWGTLIMDFELNPGWTSTNDEVAAAFAGILPLFLEVAVFGNLFIQAKAILSATKPVVRNAILAALTSLYVVAIGFNGYYYGIALKQSIYPQTPSPVIWATTAGGWLMSAAIMAFSAVFGGNVALVVSRRVKMGIRRQDALQIMIAVSIESFIVPFIFALVMHFDTLIPDPRTIAMESVAILLPFGSLWARMQTVHEVLQREEREQARLRQNNNSSNNPLTAFLNEGPPNRNNSQSLQATTSDDEGGSGTISVQPLRGLRKHFPFKPSFRRGSASRPSTDAVSPPPPPPISPDGPLDTNIGPTAAELDLMYPTLDERDRTIPTPTRRAGGGFNVARMSGGGGGGSGSGSSRRPSNF